MGRNEAKHIDLAASGRAQHSPNAGGLAFGSGIMEITPQTNGKEDRPGFTFVPSASCCPSWYLPVNLKHN